MKKYRVFSTDGPHLQSLALKVVHVLEGLCEEGLARSCGRKACGVLRRGRRLQAGLRVVCFLRRKNHVGTVPSAVSLRPGDLVGRGITTGPSAHLITVIR